MLVPSVPRLGRFLLLLLGRITSGQLLNAFDNAFGIFGRVRLSLCALDEPL
jgi:hypothetical protein